MTFEQEHPKQHPLIMAPPAPIQSGAPKLDGAHPPVPGTSLPSRTGDPAVLQRRMDLLGHWADASGPHAAGSKKSQSGSGFELISEGNQGRSVGEMSAPSQLALPREMTQGMQTAWNQSFPIGESREQGGLLVRNRDGSLKWLPGQAGSSSQFSPNYDDASPHQSVVAVGHTHPYSYREHNLTNVPFSGDDLAQHVFEQQRLSIVQSGQGLFGSARTLEFDALVKARGQAGEEALADEIRELWKGAFFSHPGDSRERAEAATRATSERYHLLYYVGKQGILNRVVPELAAKHRDK